MLSKAKKILVISCLILVILTFSSQTIAGPCEEGLLKCGLTALVSGIGTGPIGPIIGGAFCLYGYQWCKMWY